LVHSSIKNLIFDLGGVLLNLHLDRTHRAFAEASNTSVDEVRSRISASPFFNNYEKGLHSDREFRGKINEFLKTNLSDQEIDRAWNAMLGDVPADRLDLLGRLRSNYKIFLLSNTNQIHLDSFSAAIRAAHQQASLDSFFDKAYYSHVMKMRKPDAEIFQFVLNENQLEPVQTLFLDDNLDNLAGASKLGIQTFHVQHPQLIHSLFA
jgi:putative hydrolase of the HAD superfamily